MFDFLVDEFKEEFEERAKALRESYRCNHEGLLELRKRFTSNGRLEIRNQCTRCGARPNAVSQKGWSKAQIMALPDIEEDWHAGKYYETYRDDLAKQRLALEREILHRQQVAQANYDTQWWRNYRAYLESPQWRAKRYQVLQNAKWLCQECFSDQAEHVHHKHYQTLGNEDLDDLQAVCRGCHEQIHGKQIGKGGT